MYMRSGFEYQVRDNLKAQGADFEYETEVLEYLSLVRGSKCLSCGSKVYKSRKYTPDFIVIRPDCSKLYIEAKGRLTSTDRSKMRDVKKAHPHLDIRILLQKRSKKEMETVAKWCEKFDFEYAFGNEVPATWL